MEPGDSPCRTCGSRPVWNEDIVGFLAGPTVEKRLTAGAANGEYTTAGSIAQGIEAAKTAIEALGKSAVEVGVPATDATVQDAAMTLFHVPHIKRTALAPKQFVDYQNDVTAAGIELSCREGFESIEHVKRYTAMGFGTDQGKLGNINGMAITAKCWVKRYLRPAQRCSGLTTRPSRLVRLWVAIAVSCLTLSVSLPCTHGTLQTGLSSKMWVSGNVLGTSQSWRDDAAVT